MKKIPALVGSAFLVGGLIGTFVGTSFLSSEEEPSRLEDYEATETQLPAQSEPKGIARPEEVSPEASTKAKSFSEQVEAATSYDSHRRQQYELERLFESMSADEAEGMLHNILEVSEPQLRGSLLRPFFVKWGELEGELAYATANELQGRDRSDGVSASLAGWAHTDVHAAWEVALPMIDEPSYRFTRLARGVVAEMAEQDPDVLLNLLAQDSSNQKYSTFGYNLINQAFESDSQSQLLSKFSVVDRAEDRNNLVSQLFQRWGSLDTGAPLDALSKIEDPDEAKSALEGFLRGWVESDRDGALNYAFDNQADPAVQASFGSMIQSTFRFSTAKDNEALIARLENEGLLKELAPKIGSQLSFIQPEIGLRLAEAVEDPREKRQLQQQSLNGLARHDFDKARLYLDSIESVEERAGLVPNVSWALTNRSDGGEQLVALMDSFPAGKERTQIVERLLSSAGRPQMQLSDGYKEGLSMLAEGESELSDQAKESLSKLVEPNP